MQVQGVWNQIDHCAVLPANVSLTFLDALLTKRQVTQLRLGVQRSQTVIHPSRGVLMVYADQKEHVHALNIAVASLEKHNVLMDRVPIA